MVTEIQLFESPDLTPLDFCLCVWKKCEFYKRNVDTGVELLADILGAVARNKREAQLEKLAICVSNCKMH
jgi:hypothetical protein